jgi:hypothetical protein
MKYVPNANDRRNPALETPSPMKLFPVREIIMAPVFS